MNLNETLPTAKIRHKGGNKEIYTINLTDYDSTKHELVTDKKDLAPMKPLEPEQKAALTAANETGTVTTPAANETGTVTTPAAGTDEKPVFTVGSNGQRGKKQKWNVFNAENAVVGDDYATKKDAEKQLKTLLG